MSEHQQDADFEPTADHDDEGFVLDEWGNPYGYCNACGEEAPAYQECCEDGEVVPYGDRPYTPDQHHPEADQ